MTKARLFPLLTAALLLAACAAPEPEPTPTAVPTFTVVPTATATQTPEPTPTPKPLVKPFMIVEGMVIHQLCEAIQVEYPQAGCPIVAHEDVPLDHKFMAFMDENGELTGYGLDFGKEPLTEPGQDGSPAVYTFDPAADPTWCGESVEFQCDAWVLWNNNTAFEDLGLDVGNGFWIVHFDEASKNQFITPVCDCEGVWVIRWALFPISLQYGEALEELGVPFIVYGKR